jgi:hypothetical protein
LVDEELGYHVRVTVTAGFNRERNVYGRTSEVSSKDIYISLESHEIDKNTNTTTTTSTTTPIPNSPPTGQISLTVT